MGFRVKINASAVADPELAGVRRITLRPYKIFYRVEEADQVVEILRFWHSSRGEPDFP